jgi:hypothetical protein
MTNPVIAGKIPKKMSDLFMHAQRLPQLYPLLFFILEKLRNDAIA